MQGIPKFRKVLAALVACSTFYGYAQERYLDSVFSEIKLNTFVFSDTLALDVYTPVKDTVTNRPLVVLVHGGGFAIGKKDNPLEKKFCTTLAKKGYLVASISYRLTRKGKSFGCDCPAADKVRTFRTASEDVLYATRYLVRNSNQLGFDTDKIVLIGSSAGAEAVLNTVFMHNHHEFNMLPYDKLKFSGVVSFAGAVLDKDYITEHTAVPTLLFHGKKDILVPYATAAHHYCDEDTPGYLMLAGSGSIAQRLSKLNTPYVLYFDPEGNHDWANTAYAYTEEVSAFIKTIILNGEWVQSKIKLNPEKY
ncbi:MAG: lipase [Muricauda sp.]|nr:alpha/beta hydrolase [Allomuricauda sp.]MAU26792.1 lipase [Allomuricauda sp.]MBC30597.1 lipase [Allomuricauda sp.]|tara:strand:- start:1421 stop:2341 length:921 start_codon:yes stop_codon:yes gene_type:complete